MRLKKKAVLLLSLSSALVINQVWAHDETVSPTASAETVAGASEPLYDNLGDLSYPITTQSELAQQYFDQGLRWTYAFNHAAARRAFQEAQRQDPECALCYWGEAFVLGPNINAPMEEGATNPAVVAINKAKELAHHASEREQALINALARRYADDPNADRAALNQAYADAMGEAATRFPEDHEIAVLYVDSLMNLSPWDYWEADGKTPKGKIGEAIATAEKVLAENPNHPGAIHLYIHLTEASTTPERAEPYANRLAALIPGAGHIVHMGAHTFYRIGRFHDSAEINKEAVKADEIYFTTVNDDSVWAQGYHPHNIHFVSASALMAGDAASALEYAKRLDGKIADQMAAKIGWIQLIKQAPYFAHAHFSHADTILMLQDPGDRFPLVKAAWHYARGVAYARQGEADKARGEAAQIAAINQDPNVRYPADVAPVVPDVLRIAQHVVEGRIAQAGGNWDKAVREFQIAAQIQDSLPYLEPPFWYYPVHQSLGAALIEAGKPEQAEKVLEASLAKVPNNGWALYGLMQAQKAQGKDAAAEETRKRFQQAWNGDPGELLDLRRL